MPYTPVVEAPTPVSPPEWTAVPKAQFDKFLMTYPPELRFAEAFTWSDGVKVMQAEEYVDGETVVAKHLVHSQDSDRVKAFGSPADEYMIRTDRLG